MENLIYTRSRQPADRNRQTFRRLRGELPTWYFELLCDTAAAATRWQEPQQPQPRPAKRIDVRGDQAELVAALRKANPSRWPDHALAELLGISVAAVEALVTSTEAIPCHAA